MNGSRLLLLAVLLTAISCRQSLPVPVPAAATPAEAPLAEQIAAVRRGESTRIQVEQQPLRDADLLALADLATLEALLIDHPQSEITAAGLAHLQQLPQLSHLRLRGGRIDDEALAQIAWLDKLAILNVPRGDFTDRGLAHLERLPRLVQLRFGSRQVTDAGIESLARFPALVRLHLIDVPFTERGLASLATIKQLESLYIDGTPLPDAAWGAFFQEREKLGRVHVHLDQQHHDRDPHSHPH